MKTISKVIMLSVLVIALASCNTFAPKPTETPIPAETSSPTPTNTSEPTTIPTETPVSITSPTPTQSQSPNIVHLGTSWADFSLKFKGSEWEVEAFKNDFPGLEVLTHRSITGCQITPNIPVGLGAGWTMEDGQKNLGQLTLSTRRFWQQGQLKFVAYYGFLGNLQDGAVEVHFQKDSAACIAAAEELFASAEVIRPTPIP